MKGRPADWRSQLEGSKPQRWLAAATAAGFSGVYVDRFGYDDGGRAIEAKLARLVGGPSLVSANARLVFFDVTQLGRRIHALNAPAALRAARAAILDPPRIVPGANFRVLPAATGTIAGAFTGTATISIRNGLRRYRQLELDAMLSTDLPTPMRVSVVSPDGRRLDYTVAPGRPLALALTFSAPPGASPVRLAVAAPFAAGAPPPLLRVVSARVYDLAAGAVGVG